MHNYYYYIGLSSHASYKMPVSHRNVSIGYTIRMLSKGNGDSSEICKLRRSRRIRLRKKLLQAKVSSSSSVSDSQPLAQGKGPGDHFVEMTDPFSAPAPDSRNTSPVVGSVSIIGRRRAMEDEVSIQQNLCSPDINSRRPVHFFAIYDGHGGRHVSALCRERMHVLLEEELMRVRNNSDMSGGSRISSSGGSGSQHEVEAAWKRVLRRCFHRIDEMVSCTCDCGSVGYQCGCPLDPLGLTGSTAVVAILTDDAIIVANCGDSRAVLSRGGRAIPLSVDHKPDRRDERARIEACGGQIVFAHGPRVQGILAMSRAIGDKYLKPYVISEPEITFTKREAEDECLILASDGLWDVISSEMACDVARVCLREEHPAGNHSSRPLVEGDGGGAMFSSRSASAAALLTKLAMGRISYDNISVIVVDLKRNHAGG